MPFGKTILLVTDQAVHIYTMAGKSIKIVDSLSWDSEGVENDIVENLMRKCGGRPVVVLNDMVEQHYRKENAPKVKVSALDKRSIIKRKLGAAFPNYPFRAFALQKEKGPRKAETYIFSALPQSRQLQMTIKSLRDAQVSVSALCLLPVEVVDMITKLSTKVIGKEKKSLKWNLFVSQHKDGGLRQIVVKDGDLALTRMTPIANKGEAPQKWVADIKQEIRATTSYLSRFGYSVGDGLGVVVLADSAHESDIETVLGENAYLSCITNTQAANMLGLSIGFGWDEHYGDPLHVAWNFKKTKYTMPMQGAQLEVFSIPRKNAYYGTLALSASALILASMAFGETTTLKETRAALTHAHTQKQSIDKKYEALVKENEALGFDVTLVQGASEIYKELENNNYPSAAIMRALAESLGGVLRLNAIEVSQYEGGGGGVFTAILSRGGADKGDPLYETVVELKYPSTADIDAGNGEVENLRDRIEGVLPGYDILVEKLLKDYEYTEGLVVETGGQTEQNDKDFIAQIVIRGPFPKSKEAMVFETGTNSGYVEGEMQ
ncbi:MAG: hypothetical protein ACRBCT_07320 [Alphaproteobacteria bacterium]